MKYINHEIYKCLFNSKIEMIYLKTAESCKHDAKRRRN